jgi:hypothetical protein
MADWNIRMGQMLPSRSSSERFVCIAWATPDGFWDGHVLSCLVEFAIHGTEMECRVLGYRWNANWRAVTAAPAASGYLVGGDDGLYRVDSGAVEPFGDFPALAINAAWIRGTHIFLGGRNVAALTTELEAMMNAADSESANFNDPSDVRRMVKRMTHAKRAAAQKNHGILADVGTTPARVVPIAEPILAMHGTSGGERIVATGFKGSVLSYTGEGWVEEETTPSNDTLSFVYCERADAILVGGEAGGLYRWDGAETWRPIKVPDSEYGKPTFTGATHVQGRTVMSSTWAGLWTIDGEQTKRLSHESLGLGAFITVSGVTWANGTGFDESACLTRADNDSVTLPVSLDFESLGIDVPEN